MRSDGFAQLRVVGLAWRRGAVLGEADEREVPERRKRATFDQRHALRLLGPARVTRERNLRAPAELARSRLEPMFERAAKARFGADATCQDDLAAGFEH